MQVSVVDAESAVIFVGDLGEHRRPQEFGVGALVAGPGGRAQMSGGGVAGHCLLQFQADDQCGPVIPGPQIGDRCQCGNTARRAGRLMPRGRSVPEAVAHRRRHGAEVPLGGEHLAEGVGYVDHTDVGGINHRIGQGLIHHLAGQVGEIPALPAQIPGEIALVSTEDPHVRTHRVRLLPTARGPVSVCAGQTRGLRSLMLRSGLY